MILTYFCSSSFLMVVPLPINIRVFPLYSHWSHSHLPARPNSSFFSVMLSPIPASFCICITHSVSYSSFLLCCLVTKSCLTLCDPRDCSPPGSSFHGIYFPDKNTGVGFHSLLQGIFHTQGSNPHLYWQADSSPLNHPGSPLIIYFVILLQLLHWESGVCFNNKMVKFNQD